MILSIFPPFRLQRQRIGDYQMPYLLQQRAFIMSIINMGDSSKFPKSWTFETPVLKLAVCPLNIHNLKFKRSNAFRKTENKSEKLVRSP